MKEKRNLYLHLADKCNLNCLHCYCGERLVKRRLMTFDFFQNISHLFTGEFNVVTLTGGEPVLSPIFYKAVAELNKIGCYLRLDTNGQDLDDFFKRITPKMISEIRFSLDGSKPEINDVVRRKAGSFKRCVENIKKALKFGFFVEMTSTIQKKNYQDVFNIINLAKKLGVSVMNFHAVTVNGNSRHNDVEIYPKAWLEVIEKQIKPQKDIIIKYPPRFAMRGIPDDYCGCAGSQNNRLSVFADGQAFNCALYFDTNLNGRIIEENKIIFTKSPNELDDFTKINQKNRGACQRFYDITTFKKENLDKDKIIPLCIYYKKTLNCQK